MSESKTLETLQVGDEVIVHSGVFGGYRSVHKVEKVHKVHIIVNGLKYRKNGGYRVGEWTRGSIRPATPELLEEIRMERLETELDAKIRESNWRGLPIEAKQRIVAILDETALAQARGEESGL